MNIFRQNRILKGNVSIMVILILLACSLMGILTVVFLKSLITYTDDTYSYHKSYYIAKAGLELALVEIDNSAMGFSHEIESGDVINNNFECVGCHFTSNIQGRSKIISNNFWESGECTDENALVLQPGQSMMIPMFYDAASGFNEIFSGVNFIELLGSKRNNLGLSCKINCSNKLNIGVIFQVGSLSGDISWEYLYMTGMSAEGNNFFKNYFDNFNGIYTSNDVWGNPTSKKYYPYIIISNPNNDNISFCITDSNEGNGNGWPTTKYFISSLGEYMGKTVGLQAIYAQPTPSFFINAYSSY